MPLIEEEDRKFIEDYFSRELEGPVKITYFTQHKSPLVVPSQVCQFCKETKEILEEVTALSDKITLDVKDILADEAEAKAMDIERIPAAILEGAGKGKVRFFGIPSGYEFASLIEVIADLSKGKSDLKDETKKALSGITKPLHIQVFVTPT